MLAQDEGDCVPCTLKDSDGCKPGSILRFCSNVDNTDASCSEECSAELYGKPPDTVSQEPTSEWLWTRLEYTYNLDGSVSSRLVINPTGGIDGRPNVGCKWACSAGYRLVSLDTSSANTNITFCLQV